MLYYFTTDVGSSSTENFEHITIRTCGYCTAQDKGSVLCHHPLYFFLQSLPLPIMPVDQSKDYGNSHVGRESGDGVGY